ncbi:hypothetical protein BV210_00975 [Halorientalis sp. IM1011]|uniref:hypothetical protein n=1 Tax=Halorientalis sp. IM1011 TaxID=1932360 RepID=UPI00097CC718|nr:hypothetical protein [Halorientalis sp. IM1011]AQL41372.1 hypothetical protein BV210_00975 [Halorientalis sp. IM1011]
MYRDVTVWAVVTYLLSIIVFTTVAAGGAGAAPTSSVANATVDGGPPVTATVERVGATGALDYELAFDDLSTYDRVSVVVGRDATVTATDGMSATVRDGRTWLRPEDGDEATVRVRTTVSATDRSGSDGEFFAAEGWLLGRVPLVELRWAADDGRIDRRRLLGNVRGRSASVTAGDRYALVGEHHQTTVTAAGGEIRIVRPVNTELGPDATDLTAALADAADRLDVGDRGDDVLLFALGSPVRRGGESFPVDDEGWINADTRLDDPNSVWLHEYVHTRQDFRLAADMRWFREASAEYYAARLAHEQGRIDRAAMEAHLDGEPKAAALTDPGSWDDPHVPYTKGARVLALVDRNIRLSTDGKRSLEDVFRRLNTHDGLVTYADFKDAVAAVTGHRMDGWLDRYVDGTTPVAGFYPGGPARTGLLGGLWALLSDAGPAGVFLVLSVLLSGVGSVPLYRYLDGLAEEDADGRDERPGRPA